MNISVSNLPFAGFHYTQMQEIPSQVGLELFIEFGTEYYWEKVLQELHVEQGRQHLSFHGPCLTVNLADPSDTHYLSLYESFFRFAAFWKPDFIVLHTNEELSGEPILLKQLVEKRLNELLDLTAVYDLPLAIENVGLHSKKNLLYDYKQYLDLLQKFPQARALIDTGHAHANAWNLPETIAAINTRLVGVHLHDNGGWYDEHLPIGKGTINWEPVFESLSTHAPQSSLILEYDNVNLADVQESLNLLARQFSK